MKFLSIRSVVAISMCAVSYSLLGAPKYYLNGGPGHTVDDGNAFQNAKWWNDEKGNPGVDGDALDPTGDYYAASGYNLFTVNTQNEIVPFECNSLHIGEVGGNATTLHLYLSKNAIFKVLGEGLFLHNGKIYMNWKPHTIDGNITVDAPISAPFIIYDRFSDTVLNIPATMHSPKGAGLQFYAYNKDSSSGLRTLIVNLTGDCSDWLGTFIVGKETATDGRNTALHLPEGGIAGSVMVKSTGTAVVADNDIKIGGISFENGSTFKSLKGKLVVTNSFSVTGVVNVDISDIVFQNVEYPKHTLLTFPADSGVSIDNFNITGLAADKYKSVVFSIENDSDGNKSLYANVVRKSVYVSPEGDNSNSGLDADNAFKTLAYAVSVLQDGVIYALPGTYAEGKCDTESGITHSRVHVPGSVVLKSTAGAESTIIKGEKAANGDAFGEGSTRCVKLDDGAVLQGFTLTEGYVSTSNESPSVYAQSLGGGVIAGASSVIADCYLYNNTALRGGAGYGGNYIRCTFGTNTASKAQWSGPDLFGQSLTTRAFDCLFLSKSSNYNHVYESVTLYNCTIPLENYGGPSTRCKMYNCLIRVKANLPSKNNEFYNCVLAMQPEETAAAVVNCVVTNLSNAIDQKGRLVEGSPAIDVGDRAAYLAGWDAAGINRAFLWSDLYGVRRVYNGAIDVGCSEYDWRGNYTEAVSLRRLEVVEASEDVTIDDDSAIKLVDGASIQLNWNCVGGEGLYIGCNANVIGAGMLTVMKDGVVVDEVELGASKFMWKATAENHVIKFVYKGEGEALIGAFENKNGLKIRIR